MAAAGVYGVPDVRDDPGAVRLEHFQRLTGRDVPVVRIAAGTVKARLLEGLVIVQRRVSGQSRRNAIARTILISAGAVTSQHGGKAAQRG